MPVFAVFDNGDIQAIVTATSITEGPNAGCISLQIENNSIGDSDENIIHAFCLVIDNVTGPFFIGDTELPDNGCPGSCISNDDVDAVLRLNGPNRIFPDEDETFIICPPNPGTTPLLETDLDRVSLHFQDIDDTEDSICLVQNFTMETTSSTTATVTTTDSTTSTTDSTTACPVANPQTCCQHVIEFKTQIVPPVLAGEGENFLGYIDTEVNLPQPVIEDVCPEKVIVCGVLEKVIRYIGVRDDGTVGPVELTDQRPFQCVIDREDADEDTPFEVVGWDVLCEGTPRLINRGTRTVTDSGISDEVDVYWRLVEKDIIKVCIRRTEVG